MLKKQYLKSRPACKVTFSLPVEAAEDASEVRLLGDFNDWNWESGAEMKRHGDQYRATLELEADRRYEFRYCVDGKDWLNDWKADEYVASPYLNIDNSVLILGPAPAKAKKPKAPARKKPALPAKEKATSRAAAKPSKAVKKASAPAKDDLRKIEGIGPKIAGLLQAEGINTFGDLAGAKVATLRGILEKAGSRYRMHDPKTWSKQAKLAAKGDWEKLQTMQQQLKGGK